MTSRSGFCKVTLAVSSLCFCKSAAVSFIPFASMTDSESDKLMDQEKGLPALTEVSISVFAEFIHVFNYSEADLLKILKIFLETKGQT